MTHVTPNETETEVPAGVKDVIQRAKSISPKAVQRA